MILTLIGILFTVFVVLACLGLPVFAVKFLVSSWKFWSADYRLPSSSDEKRRTSISL